jgi:DNA-directed RNA polymerase specialized sigma24 family protein
MGERSSGDIPGEAVTPPLLRPTPRFATTQWGLVTAAGGGSGEPGGEALAELLRCYWFPVYAQVRRRGHPHEEAEDLTQGFLQHMLTGGRLGMADPRRGRFRSFLLASLEHFLSNMRAARRAVKRGGRVRFVTLSSAESEGRWRDPPSRELPPDRAFDRHWALVLIEIVLRRLRAEWVTDGRREAFELLESSLTDGESGLRSADLGRRLGMSDAAVRMAVHRLRQRYRVLIREEIARTLADEALVEDELRALLGALRDESGGPN